MNLSLKFCVDLILLIELFCFKFFLSVYYILMGVCIVNGFLLFVVVLGNGFVFVIILKFLSLYINLNILIFLLVMIDIFVGLVV